MNRSKQIAVALPIAVLSFGVGVLTGNSGHVTPVADGVVLSVAEECRQALGYEGRTAADRQFLAQCVSALTPPTVSPTTTPPVTPTVTPTVAPTVVPTTVPTTVPPTPSTCALPAFPNADCTGTRAGWTPGKKVTSYTTTRDGEVIDGWLITGSLSVRHQNVTVKNSEVYGQIYNQVGGNAYNGLTITDVTVGPPSGVLNTGVGAVGVCGYAATRVEIRNSTEGFRVGGYDNSNRKCGPVTIRDSFVKLVAGPPDAHGDGIQEYDGMPPGVVVEHNTVDARAMGPRANAALFIGADGYGGTVRNNLLAGGGYAMRLHADYGATTYPDVSGNRIIAGEYYGPASVKNCSRVARWADNRVVTADANYRVTSLGATINC